MKQHRKTALIVTKFLPDTIFAGNLAYLKFIIDLTCQYVDEVAVLVLGDRFSNHEFFIKDPKQPKVVYLTRFSTRIGDYHVLNSPKLILNNLLRRVWAVLPKDLRKMIYNKYMPSKGSPSALIDATTIMDPKLISIVWQQINQRKPDYVIVDKLDYIGILDTDKPKHFRSLVLCQDLLWARQTSIAEYEASTARHALSMQEEMRQLGLADCVISIQEQEAQTIAKNVSSKVVYIPYMPPNTHPKLTRFRVNEPNEKNILFVGSAGVANITGLEWFLNEVWADVLRGSPDATLNIVGDVFKHITYRDSHIRLHGKVDSLDALYSRSSVVIAPLKFGSGLKIKMIEALSAGCACVTTSIGAQGMEEGAGKAFLVADDAAGFAEAVILMLNDIDARRSFGVNGAAFLDRLLDKSRPLRAFQEALRENDRSLLPEVQRGVYHTFSARLL